MPPGLLAKGLFSLWRVDAEQADGMRLQTSIKDFNRVGGSSISEFFAGGICQMMPLPLVQPSNSHEDVLHGELLQGHRIQRIACRIFTPERLAPEPVRLRSFWCVAQ